MNEGEVVDDGRNVREDLRDPGTRLPVLFKAEGALHQWPWIALPHLDVAFAFHGHAVVFFKRGLVLKGIEVADAAAHEERDHRLGARLEMRSLGHQGRIRDTGGAYAFGGQQLLLAHQIDEGQAADTHAGLHPEFPPGDELSSSSVVAHAVRYVRHKICSRYSM